MYSVLVTHAQVKAPQNGVLAEPVGNAGGPIYATFEGWGPLKDGTNALLLGYFNRNKTQLIDIPIGPDNSIEPGGPDMGQPTHFLTGRQYGMFAILVPKDLGHQEADLDDQREWSQDGRAVLAEPALLDRILQEHRE